MKNFVIGILLVLVILFGYLAFKPKETKTISPDITTTPYQYNTGSNQNPIDTATVPTKQVTTPEPTKAPTNPNAITKKEWGVSFEKQTTWSVAKNDSTQVSILSNPENPAEGDNITITYATGNSITDTDAKFGYITYFYDSSTKAWMETDNESGEGVYSHTTPVVATAAFYTKSGLPVFRGTGRWATYIVPLSSSTFLKMNIGGGGLTQPLADLAKTVQKI